MTNEATLLVQLLNFFLCIGIAFASFCRVRKFSKGATRRWVIWSYGLLGTSGFAAATAPLWPYEYRVLAVSSLALPYLLVMVVNSRGWKRGAPDYTKSAPMPLDPLEQQ